MLNKEREREKPNIQLTLNYGLSSKEVRYSEIKASPDWQEIESLLMKGHQVLLYCSQDSESEDVRVSLAGYHSAYLKVDISQISFSTGSGGWLITAKVTNSK